MQASDVLVFPSEHEGLPVSVLEAMASRLPIVASKIRGIYPDLLKDHESGLLLNSVSDTGIANAVSEYISDKQLCQRVTDNAKQRVKCFEIDNVLKEVSDIYASVLR